MVKVVRQAAPVGSYLARPTNIPTVPPTNAPDWSFVVGCGDNACEIPSIGKRKCPSVHLEAHPGDSAALLGKTRWTSWRCSFASAGVGDLLTPLGILDNSATDSSAARRVKMYF